MIIYSAILLSASECCLSAADQTMEACFHPIIKIWQCNKKVTVKKKENKKKKIQLWEMKSDVRYYIIMWESINCEIVSQCKGKKVIVRNEVLIRQNNHS